MLVLQRHEYVILYRRSPVEPTSTARRRAWSCLGTLAPAPPLPPNCQRAHLGLSLHPKYRLKPNASHLAPVHTPMMLRSAWLGILESSFQSSPSCHPRSSSLRLCCAYSPGIRPIHLCARGSACPSNVRHPTSVLPSAPSPNTAPTS